MEPITTDSILSTALCGVRFATRACPDSPVTRHELVIHTRDVKLHVTRQNTARETWVTWSTHPARFATSCFAPHHLSSLFFFFIHYFGITFTPPIDLGPFSNSSRGSSAGVAVVRLVFVGFSQLLNHWSLLAIGNHRWWRHRCCLWTRNQFRLAGFLWGGYFWVFLLLQSASKHEFN